MEELNLWVLPFTIWLLLFTGKKSAVPRESLHSCTGPPGRWKRSGGSQSAAKEGELQLRPHHSSRRRTWGEEAARPAWLESLHIRTATQTRGIVQLVRAQVPEAQSCVSLPRLSSCPGALRPPVQPISDPHDPRAHSEEGELDFS